MMTKNRSAVQIAKAIEDAGLAQFRADDEARPRDLLVALIYNLAVTIATMDPGGTHGLLALSMSNLAQATADMRTEKPEDTWTSTTLGHA